MLAGTRFAYGRGTHMAKGQMRSTKEPRKPRTKAAKKNHSANPSRKVLVRTADAH
jgi:hypothetical protein